MFVIDLQREIKAPPAVVWEVIADLPRYGEWNPFCIACSSTLQPGDPIDMTVKLTARPQQQREWMLACEPGAGFSYRMKPLPLGALSSLRRHELSGLDAGTTRYRSYFQLDGWLRGLVLALLRSRLEQGFTAMTDAVAQRAEALWTQRQNSRAA